VNAAEKAERLRDLHRPGTPLVLPNAWDAGTAKLVEAAGFPVVATSSAAVAEALGHDDHESAPADDMLAAAARIAAAVSVPVTVDAESGYGLPEDELVRRLIEAGAVGCNLEDTDHNTGDLRDIAANADRIAKVRAAAEEIGVPLVINARIDVFIQARSGGGHADEPALVEPALHRAWAYLDAGADCVYPILVSAEDPIRQLVDGVAGRPVNIMARPGGISLAKAAELGVARVSLGAGLWRATQSWLADRLTDLSAGRSPY
jgi:2-methylisocitrate lyase-like PEP mutase family enzyme